MPDVAKHSQVLPLYVTIGAGCIMCTYVCALKMSTHPDVVYVARLPRQSRS